MCIECNTLHAFTPLHRVQYLRTCTDAYELFHSTISKYHCKAPKFFFQFTTVHISILSITENNIKFYFCNLVTQRDPSRVQNVFLFIDSNFLPRQFSNVVIGMKPLCIGFSCCITTEETVPLAFALSMTHAYYPL